MAPPVPARAVSDPPVTGAVHLPSASHAVEHDEVIAHLGSHPLTGLSEQEAQRRLREHGPNVLPQAKGPGVLRRLFQQVHNPLIYVLLAGAAVMLAIRDFVDASVVLGVVALNVIVGFVQESKAEGALEGLRRLAGTTARVVRDGSTRSVPSAEVVRGDLVLVEAGDRIPADLRLLRHAELRVDESALTGESVPAEKAIAPVPHDTVVADRNNMAWSGTLATSGTGAGIAVATGADTQLGEISHLVSTAEQLATPLTRKLAGFSRMLTVVILALAAVTFAIGAARGQPVGEMLTAAIALAVAAIPEGLPAAVTITLAIGVVRMARRRAIIRRLPAVETLGSTTVICSDKTGTLTENRMTVEDVWTPSGGGPGSPRVLAVLQAAALCNDATLGRSDGVVSVVGDPTEGALLVAAVEAGLDLDALAADLPRVETVPFSSERRFMATAHRDVDGTVLVLVKGAVERVVARCSTQAAADGTDEPLDAAAVLAAAEALAGQGLRVITTAQTTRSDVALREEDVAGLRLTGLVAMLDPPREAATAAVAACRTAGIQVKMITGDHASTAQAIALRMGLLDDADAPGSVLTGAELGRLPADGYAQAVDRAQVFARVSPEQKLRLVQALQAQGHVAAMTGDGVNDAPALRAADIGIAMGHGGTDVAKDAADMVLLDDDFATIEAAVEEGRGVFDNLTKFIVWTLPTNWGQGLVILFAILVGTTLPILPVQILWINMTTAVALGLMLAFEPKEPGIMRRPPREPDTPLVTPGLMWQIVFVSAVLVLGSLWMFHSELAAGASDAEARTAALNAFVAGQIVYLFACRSLTVPVWRINPFGNRWVLVGVGVQVAAQLALTFLPAMNALFDTAPPRLDALWKMLAFAGIAAVAIAADQLARLGPRGRVAA